MNRTIRTKLTHMNSVIVVLVFLSGLCFLPACAQVLSGQQPVTRADTLRGSLRPERNAYDVTYYHLNIRVDPVKKYLEGYNDITFRTRNSFDRIQVDLFENMQVGSILWEGHSLTWQREYKAVFIDFPETVRERSEEHTSELQSLMRI